MNDVVIQVENTGKMYRIGAQEESYKTLRAPLVSRFKNSIKSVIPNKPDKRNRPNRRDKPDRPDKSEKPNKQDKPKKPNRPERPKSNYACLAVCRV